ncbi:hypothetical protein Rhe02_16050 [Rhizocola hellebori]|uniref:Superoxide dismutase n=1 Tax=Rhizocola hellebori TaxID=1392758 RepID=A0A8J3VF33_9ACTN|nr:SMP-30/gluconolactonase/LRE family protein [Rhizocola hellebori]GIH03538.1 hypothetical protein Rhe02_16050 [Rhizocola hellebori]
MYSISRGRWAVAAVFSLAVSIPGQAAAVGPDVQRAPDTAIVLPGAISAEGIVRGPGNTFYASDLFGGNIYKGNIKAKTAELFIDVPDGRASLGMALDKQHHLLFVAGGFTGQAYVYDTKDRSTLATFQFGTAGEALINDVVLTPTGAWFTDSLRPVLFFVPLNPCDGVIGQFTALELSGPAADAQGSFNLNGIEATPNGRTLIVAHTTNGQLYTVDPGTGSSALIAGIDVPTVDGLVLKGRDLWAVQNAANQISRIRLAQDLSSGQVVGVTTSLLFGEPSTADLFGNTLAVVNTHFSTGVPPTARQYEVVVLDAY